MSYNGYQGQAYGSGLPEGLFSSFGQKPKDWKPVPVPIPTDLQELSREAVRYGIPPVEQEMSKWCPPNAMCQAPYTQQRRALVAALNEAKGFEFRVAAEAGEKSLKHFAWAAGAMGVVAITYLWWRNR